MKKFVKLLLAIIGFNLIVNVSFGIPGEVIEYPHLKGKVKFAFWRSSFKYSKIDLNENSDAKIEKSVSEPDTWYVVLTDVKGLNVKQIEQVNFYVTRSEPIGISSDMVAKGDLVLKINGEKTMPFKIGAHISGDALIFEYDFYGASTTLRKISIK